ncbi:ABC transporter ATP-binding protein [Sphingomonas sp. HF-S4]|uniref:ABC transporter ATP-binding protein n=1 Tax=Sphingomonas agrestis TaxID=3080540 RepID=A0ABU3YCU7_9SPHN|nr:ABC transporter ATP-binding protein [Sphingomonas sp. HF-S4]MDV3459204.1 ABC transporter ATP-binding protein [Sphingomonas sp. HF-S4]
MQIVGQFEGVSKKFGGHTVLDGISLEIRAGEVTALLGPNGAGKTTTVGLLTGRLTPDSGKVDLFGLDPSRPLARARMGVMLQSAGLPDVLTVRELVTLQSGYYRRPREVAETIAIAGLDGLEKRAAGKLSGGQQRRLHYALAICGQPDLLVLDEPTTGLDHEARRRLWTTVREEADSGAAVLLTTHYLEEADALADRIVVIAEGRIIADDAPAGIKASVGGSTIRCRTMLTEPHLAALPGVRSVAHSGAAATLLVTDAATSARALLAADLALTDLTISAASLEEALANLATSTRKAA